MKNIKIFVGVCRRRCSLGLTAFGLSLLVGAQACGSETPGAAPPKPSSGGSTAAGGQASAGVPGAGTGGTGGSAGVSTTVPCADCAEFGLATRPANPTCVAGAPPPTNYTFVPIWPAITLGNAVKIVPHPDGVTLIVVEKDGVLRAVPSNPAATQAEVRAFLDLPGPINTDGESGLLSMAFHPDFAQNGYVYVIYSLENHTTRIARFQSVDGGLTADPSTEQVLLELSQVRAYHHAGDMGFGPDGYLYLSIGDNNTGDDHDNFTAADPTILYGKVLRLDVNQGPPYGIPPDNPYANGVDGAPEVYATGFRNPWRFSFDRVTNEMWLADPGEEHDGQAGEDGQVDPWEEVDKIVLGGNYGWPFFQGNRCYHHCDQGQGTPPEFEYSHNGGPAAIVGGYVYRGTALPGLVGKYIFGDYEMGEVWALDTVTKEIESLSIGVRLNAFGEDHAGEIYALRENGAVEMLQDSSVEAGGFPDLITATGCVRPEDPTKPVDGMVPFSVALPFWSDGAEKERFLALPDGTTLEVSATDGDLTLPPGGVSMKHFRWQGKLFETRFFVRHDDGSYYGYSYEWNAEQTQATLVPPSGKDVSLTGLEWTYPSTTMCFSCHSEAAGRSLGLEARQLNVPGIYPSTGLKANQLATLQHIGMINGTAPLLDPYALTDNVAVPVETRARSYLAANCSHCHRPGGPGRGSFTSAQFDTPFAQMGICNQAPDHGDLDVPGALLLTPGNHNSSLLWLRMSQRTSKFMPPIASKLPDTAGATLLAEWIDGIIACP